MTCWFGFHRWLSAYWIAQGVWYCERCGKTEIHIGDNYE